MGQHSRLDFGSAAVAAENSAKAADANIVYTHRPKLILRGIGLIPKAGTFIEMEDGSVHNSVPWEIQYVVANVGGTEATIAESNLTLTHINLTQDQQFPEFPPYSEQRDSMGVFSLEPGEYKERVVPVPEGGGVLLGMLRHSVRRGALHTAGTLYCLGFFQYVDGNGVSRRTAFFRHFDAQTERFRRDAYPETPENYDYAD